MCNLPIKKKFNKVLDLDILVHRDSLKCPCNGLWIQLLKVVCVVKKLRQKFMIRHVIFKE